MMPTPTPTPGAAPTGNSAGAQAYAASGIVLPDAGSAKSQYGLGNLAGASVNVGGLMAVLGKDGKLVQPDPKTGTYTAEQVLTAFTHASPGTVAQIQHMLVLGGFYGSNYTPNYGVLNKDDIDAFSTATTTAAQTGGDLNEYLSRQAKFGEYQGVAAAVAQQKPRTIEKADPLQLGSLIEKEFQALTGRKPNDAEKAGFIAAYNTAYAQIQNQNYDAAAGAATPTDGGYSSAPPAYLPGVTPQHGGIGGFLSGAVNAVSSAANSILQQQDAANLAKEPATPPAAGTVTTQDFDPQSFAEQYVRQHATGETDAHDIASQFGSFLQIIQKGVG